MTAADWTTIGQPQDIRLVVADMDGTLLDERSRIPDGFWPMLARLKRRGVEFVPASGRQYATLRNMFADKAAEILDGGELSYIAENGNVVALDGKVVEVHGVDLDVTSHVIDLVDDAAASGEHNVGLVVCGLKSAYVQRSDKPFLDEVGKYYAALSIETDDGSFAAGRSQDTGLTMRISNMTLAEKGLPATRQQITDNLFAMLQRLDYVPATVTMPGDPAFEPGDRVALPMEDGTAPEMLVTHFVWRYRGRQTLKGVGRNPYLGGTTDGATEKALRRLQNSAESKRIVYYSFTNPAELAVQTVETPAVAIAFTAVEETSAMFLAQLLLDAAPDTDADRAVLYKRRACGKFCAAAAAGDGRTHAGAVLPVCVGGGRDGHAAVGAAGLRGRHGEDRALRHQGHRDRAGHGKRDAVGRHAGM